MFCKIWNGRAKPTMPAMKTDIARIDVMEGHPLREDAAQVAARLDGSITF